MDDLKRKILEMVSDAALEFAMDREGLKTADIVSAIENGALSFTEIGEAFGRALAEHLSYHYDEPAENE